eukprot:maker-scaffold_6-augustus-gene-18.52-mRNA-1 protein AED:0.09 eAED:0.09 QI:0/0.5/0.33/1/0.5/0.33/3/60/160
MGGMPKYRAPKVWTPSGGWWYTPKNWKSNTLVSLGVCGALSVGLFMFSTSKEQIFYVRTPGTLSRKNFMSKPRESILDLKKHIDKKVQVKFFEGRIVVGILKGYDPLTNIVLDEAEEILRDDEQKINGTKTRKLGLLVCKGTAVTLVNPVENMTPIENPF